MRFTTSLLVIGLLGGLSCAEKEVSPVFGETDISESEMFTADFELVDQYGKKATDERFEGKPMFIYAGFATCPDICPAALSIMSATLNELGHKADQVAPIFLTIDPERDTPAVLKAHLAFDERILGLTGSVQAAEQASKSLLIYASKEPLDSALEYTMNHSSMFYITDASGAPMRALKDDMAPKDIAKILKRYL